MVKKSSDPKKKIESVLVLPDIRSVYNVGALFRTADAVGISRIILGGFTPTPIDRFGRPRADFAKSALGSELTMPWEYVDNVTDAIEKLRTDGFTIIGIEQAETSIDYKDLETPARIAFVVGTETTGMPPEMIALCDHIVEIPMRGGKESLNVSVATGIVLYRVLDL